MRSDLEAKVDKICAYFELKHGRMSKNEKLYLALIFALHYVGYDDSVEAIVERLFGSDALKGAAAS
jgi:hypothetical protein